MFVITGGSRGLGAALALALAAREQAVLIIGRQKSTLTPVSKQSPLIDYLAADVSTAKGREAIVQRLEPVHSISALIHNAGIIDPITSLMNLDEKSWGQFMATNVDPMVFLTQRLLKPLQGGKVLHVGSGAAYFPVIGWSGYCVSKAALSMLTRCWQLECGNPAFASVMPGIADTEMVATICKAKGMKPAKRDFFKQLKKNDQLILSDTVALFLTWLLLDITPDEFQSKEWDIYDATHHSRWLPDGVPVPHLEV